MKSKNVLFLIIILLTSFIFPHPASAEVSIPQQDQTPIIPLGVPGPAVRARYISGFGMDNTYTIFYEDRNDIAGCSFGSRIYYHHTSSGPLGLSASIKTDICDTHFIVKNWPITIGATTYAYRGWGAVGNNPDHTFYVSNNLTNWTQVGPFFNFPNPFGDQILYGFHDIVQINGNYIGFAESAGGHTYIVWSDNGDQTWSVIARVGGSALTDHLVLPASPTPTGNFILLELGGLLTYGKLYNNGSNSAAYLIINRAAAQAATPAQAEAAFLNPLNWTWSDDSTGQPLTVTPVLTNTFGSGGHNIKESWIVPISNPRSDHVILYTADYASGGARLGCAADNAQCLVVPSLHFPTVVASNPTNGAILSIGPTQVTIIFNENVYDPMGNGGTNDVTNPANFLLVKDGTNGTFDTASCVGGLKSDDVQITVNSVSYNPTTFTSTVNINGGTPLPNGKYRLFVCGTTSVVDYMLSKLNNGLSDYISNFVVASASTAADSSLPRTGFTPNKITPLPAQLADLAYANLGSLWLEIPLLNIKTNIVGVPQSKTGWDVKWLGQDAGWLNGTAFPTWEGNSVVTAHVTDSNGLPGPFAEIKDLKYGDQIIVHLYDQQYIFEIRDKRLVLPETTTFAYEHLERNSYLTLITCQSYDPSTDIYRLRRVIRAVLVSVK